MSIDRITPSVLVIVEAYEPAFKAGGPVRSIKNIVSWLAGEIKLYIYTRDRDLGDTSPFPNLPTGQWIRKDGVQVWYASPNTFMRGLIRVIKELRPDVIYINSLFAPSARFLCGLNAMGVPLADKLLLAPRGEVQPGALRQKWAKKIIALTILRLVRATKGIYFHATSLDESVQLRRIFGRDKPIYLVPNLTARVNGIAPPMLKRKGELSLVYLSRITPKKNLLFLMDLLGRLSGKVSFEVIGPIDDPEYWREVLNRSSVLTTNVTFRYAGDIPHREVIASLQRHHAFALPTLSENYGHAIVEAWSAGLPVVISNRTPWRKLSEHGIGWDLELDPETWRITLQRCVDMTPNEFLRLQESARNFAEEIMSAPPLAGCRRMLNFSHENETL